MKQSYNILEITESDGITDALTQLDLNKYNSDKKHKLSTKETKKI